MTDKIDSLLLESLRAEVVRLLKANPGIAKSSSASKRIASREVWPAERCRWRIDEQQNPCFNS
jgi:hypothetical protein